MQKKREEANPARADAIIGSAIPGMPGGARNADNMPALATPIIPMLRDYPRAAGGGAVHRPPAAHPAAVHVDSLIPANGGGRVVPIQTGHSTNKRKAAIVAIAAGGISPATKSRNTDSMIEKFEVLQQEGLQAKNVKAHAALLTAKAAQIQNQLQTLMFFEKQPDSDLKQLIVSNAQKSLAELSKPDDSYSPRADPGRQLQSDPFERDSIPAEVVAVKDCKICQNDIEANTPSMVTPCMHTFHFGCLRSWLALNNDTCPTCRGSLSNPINPQEQRE